MELKKNLKQNKKKLKANGIEKKLKFGLKQMELKKSVKTYYKNYYSSYCVL